MKIEQLVQELTEIYHHTKSNPDTARFLIKELITDLVTENLLTRKPQKTTSKSNEPCTGHR